MNDALVRRYIEAVWDYCVEHSDLTKEGSYFVKFHTDSKVDFNKRILARLKGYHRGDPRYRTLNPKDKENYAQGIKKHAILKKESKIKDKPRTTKQKIRSSLIRIINKIFE